MICLTPLSGAPLETWHVVAVSMAIVYLVGFCLELGRTTARHLRGIKE